ncbi:alpha/beta fold hydrolase [Pollutimonas harenae]|uniref:Alpha/beta hydrolase n=1 Tax=Pollutimonas harenae TaxID=657015 RepID=A0A853GQJ5_9BURK|nr:alpha/beta hydrolase [Pollutimonas harenae]NYT84437.1 alpha/beta hydrolase [Pollutimonas harenae]TEA73162.1 alpha/beta hydrolase [Pollutimonas harenae]
MTFIKDVQTGTASCGDTQISYFDSDPENTHAETIVLLHGTGGSAENNFWALLPMLAMRHRVVALNFVDPETETPTADCYLEQVHAVVKHVAHGKPVHVAGYSFGAVIAALFAARHDACVKSLTLIAGWVKTDNQQRLRNAVWRSLYESNHDALAPFSVLLNYSQAFLNSKNEAELEGLSQSIRNGPDRSRKMEFNKNVDITNDLAGIQVPSLVIACVHDQMVPLRHARMLFGAIADCRYAEIMSGHGVVHERPSELFTMIDMFVQDPTALPAGQLIKNNHA